MGKIHLLSPTLQNQIAAGEVVERPASIVKELVENSIDAGALQINIQISEGGVKKIRIIDNGCGMSADDAQMAFKRYATSKIATVDDLFTLDSFGFRGEAIASIASVSNMILRTKRSDDQTGTQVSNGEETCPCALQTGTEIIVENLFWNVPARRKFLKSPQTESREITKTLESFALANPHISFLFTKNEKEIFHFTAQKGENALAHRATEVLGKSMAENFLPLQWQGQVEKISGFVSHPNFHRSTRDKQFLFVNGRIIQGDSLFFSALSQSYQTLLPKGKFPACVVFITLPADLVDVNVHPRKTQVKFQNPQQIFQMIKNSVLAALSTNNDQEKISPNANPYIGFKRESHTDTSPSSVFTSHRGTAIATPQYGTSNIPASTAQQFFSPSIPGTERSPSDELDAEQDISTPLNIRVIGQVRKSFIIVETPNGIRMIDQHAAHERIRYEELLREFRAKKIISQPLLTPVVMSIASSEKNLVLEKQQDLQDLGFETEDFGGNDIAITSLPAGNTKIDVQKLFRDLLDDLDSFDPSFGEFCKSLPEKMLSYTACRGSIKFGDTLTHPEMEKLVQDLQNCSHPQACAHGRPVEKNISFREIENDCGRY